MEARLRGLSKQEDLIAAAVSAATRDERVLAAWLVGSLTNDQADAVSDIDFHILVSEEELPAFVTGWVDLVRSFTDTVATKSFAAGVGGYAITPDWMHIDIAVHGGQPTIHPGSGLRVLFDRTSAGSLPADSRAVAVTRSEPTYPAEVVDWFFYMLGNLAVVVARDEPVLGTNGVVALRDTCLVPLMYAEAGVARTGGNKRLRPFLTAEQHHVLQSLPAIEPTIASVVQCYEAIASEFVTRGRALATLTGATWPEAFELATAAHLERVVGRRIPA